MGDDSRKVAGLGDKKQEEHVARQIPQELQGVIKGGVKASGFFENLARGTAPGQKPAAPAPATLIADPARSEATPTGAAPAAAPAPAPEAEPPAVKDPPVVIPDAVPVHDHAKTGRCAHCGLNFKEIEDVEPTKEDVRNFVAYILGAADFSKTYAYMSGGVKAVFRPREAREVDSIIRILRALVAEKKLPEMPISMNESYVYNMQRLELSVSLSRLEIKDRDPIVFAADWRAGATDAEIDKAIVARHTQITNHVNETMMTLLLHSQRKFAATLNILMQRMTDPDFYSPTAG
jgi:hypothetical protein